MSQIAPLLVVGSWPERHWSRLKRRRPPAASALSVFPLQAVLTGVSQTVSCQGRGSGKWHCGRAAGDPEVTGSGGEGGIPDSLTELTRVCVFAYCRALPSSSGRAARRPIPPIGAPKCEAVSISSPSPRPPSPRPPGPEPRHLTSAAIRQTRSTSPPHMTERLIGERCCS